MTPKTLYYNFCKEHISDFPYNTEEEFYSIDNCLETRNFHSHLNILHFINYKFPHLVLDYYKPDNYVNSCGQLIIKLEEVYVRITICYEIYYHDEKIIQEINVKEVIPVEKTIIEYIVKE
jgi:hypothetical protein